MNEKQFMKWLVEVANQEYKGSIDKIYKLSL